MKEEIFIEDLAEPTNIKIKLNNEFTRQLFERASKCKKPHCNLEFIKRLKLKPTTKYVNTTIYGWINKDVPISINLLSELMKLAEIKWNEIDKKISYISSKTNRIKIDNIFPIKMDKKLGSIIGHILGDGSIDKKHNHVFFSNSDKELLKEFSTNMKTIFNIEPRIWMQKEPEFGNTHWDKRLNSINELTEGRNGGLFYPTICGLILNRIFGDFAIGINKKIGIEILKANKDFKIGLIRAFYDDESNVGQKNIRLFQDRKDMLEIFRSLLNEFEISSNQVKRYIKHDKERYYFDIFRKSNLRKFDEQIGFTSPKKSNKLKEIVNRKPHFNDK